MRPYLAYCQFLIDAVGWLLFLPDDLIADLYNLVEGVQVDSAYHFKPCHDIEGPYGFHNGSVKHLQD